MAIRVLIVALLLITFPLSADRTFVDYGAHESTCATDFDPNSTWLSILGDSLGESAGVPLLGYFGWNAYLTAQAPEIYWWDVQNLARFGWTTQDVYFLITYCALDRSDTGGVNRREHFRTADNVFLEIGGNDVLHHVAFNVMAPWMMPRVNERVVFNTRVVIRTLRHPRRNKKVIVSGNFPAIARSPSLGDWPDYFKMYQINPSDQLLIQGNELNKQLGINRNAETILLMANELKSGLSTDMNVKQYTTQVYTHIKDKILGSDPEIDWYHHWLKENTRNPISHATSLALFFQQAPLQAMVEEENALKGHVHFLPMYQYFVRWEDCLGWGQCWVANPLLYGDIVHINYLGYYIWSAHLAAKIRSLGWQNDTTAENQGRVTDPPSPITDDPAPAPVIIEPQPIDWLLLWCLLTGDCFHL